MPDEIQPPESDELFEEDESDEKEKRRHLVQVALQRANQYHAMIDEAKEWSRERSADVLVEAALEQEEEDAREIAEVAELVRTVARRIEQGDNSLARRP